MDLKKTGIKNPPLNQGRVAITGKLSERGHRAVPICLSTYVVDYWKTALAEYTMLRRPRVESSTAVAS